MPSSITEGPDRVLRDGVFLKVNICPKDECDMIAEAVLIAEGPLTKKEIRAKSAAPYLLTDTLPQNYKPDSPV